MKVRFTEDGGVLVGSTHDHRVLLFTKDEWVAFTQGAQAGEFDFPA